MNRLQSPAALASSHSRPVSRRLLFAGLFAIALLNALSEELAASFAAKGPLLATLETFDISVFVWLALAAGMLLIWRSPPSTVTRADWFWVWLASLVILMPVPALSWLAFSGLALVLLFSSNSASPMRRGSAILLAVTIPMFWTRIVMSVFSEAILEIDATFASWAIGTERQGNLVPFADGSGAMWIAPACSSFTNLSLAILAFVTLINITSGRWSLPKLTLGLLTCLLVVVINVARISLIGYFPAHFEFIHGAVGASIAGAVSTIAILGMGYYAVRRDALALG